MKTLNKLTLSLLLSTSIFASEDTDAYFEMSLEELMNVKVSGITRKETNTFKESSAVFVITSDEIRRFGATSIPELLQMVPGFNVGRLSSNMWAINARGDATRHSRDLLVMIDGRNVYSPTVNNVYWDHIDTMIDDIERVEIIRGPGSSLWGSNASNGIVNIVTKNSENTEGFLAYGVAATDHLDYDFGARFGIVEDNYSARIYAKKTQLENSVYPSAKEQSRTARFVEDDKAHDGKVLSTFGVRTDITLNDDINLMINAEVTSVDTDEVKISSFSEKEVVVEQNGAFIISSLDISHSQNSNSIIQVYIDHYKHKDVDFSDERTIYDFDFQNKLQTGSLTTLWGGGYRLVDHKTKQNGIFFLDPSNKKLNYYSGFLNFDYEILNKKVLLTIGSKYEDNPYTDSEFMPNAKIAYYPNDNNTLWASISRTTSTPSRTSADGFLDFSFLPNPVALGNGNEEASHKNVYELGYRTKIDKKIVLDQTLYHNKYQSHNTETDKLDYVQGYEVSVGYYPRDDLRINSFYSFEDAKNLTTATTDVAAKLPKHTFGFRTSYDLTSKHEFDLFYRYVSHIKNIDSINQLNLRFGYLPTKSIDISLLLSNLLEKDHVEANPDALRANSYIQRAAMLKLTYKY